LNTRLFWTVIDGWRESILERNDAEEGKREEKEEEGETHRKSE
jgi:hypothetical protein